MFLSLLLYVRVLLFSFLLTLSLPVNHLYKYLLRHVDRIRSTLCLVSFPLISVSRFRYELYMEVRRISLRAHTIPNLVSFPCFHFSDKDEPSDSFIHRAQLADCLAYLTVASINESTRQCRDEPHELHQVYRPIARKNIRARSRKAHEGKKNIEKLCSGTEGGRFFPRQFWKTYVFSNL